jgi:hypothetical protein
MSPVILLDMAVLSVLIALLISRPLRVETWRCLRSRPPASPAIDRFAPALVAVGLGAIPWLVLLNITYNLFSDSQVLSAFLGITAWLSLTAIFGILIVWLRRPHRARGAEEE